VTKKHVERRKGELKYVSPLGKQIGEAMVAATEKKGALTVVPARKDNGEKEKEAKAHPDESSREEGSHNPPRRTRSVSLRNHGREGQKKWVVRGERKKKTMFNIMETGWKSVAERKWERN